MKTFIQYLEEAKTDRIHHFIDFAAKELVLQNKPDVELLNKRDGSMTTANINCETLKIKIYVKGRAICDICRSIAHELVHQKQIENKEKLDGSTGSACENEANATAGKIIRLYGKANPDFYN